MISNEKDIESEFVIWTIHLNNSFNHYNYNQNHIVQNRNRNISLDQLSLSVPILKQSNFCTKKSKKSV